MPHRSISDWISWLFNYNNLFVHSGNFFRRSRLTHKPISTWHSTSEGTIFSADIWTHLCQTLTFSQKQIQEKAKPRVIGKRKATGFQYFEIAGLPWYKEARFFLFAPTQGFVPTLGEVNRADLSSHRLDGGSKLDRAKAGCSIYQQLTNGHFYNYAVFRITFILWSYVVGNTYKDAFSCLLIFFFDYYAENYRTTG